MSLNPGDLIRVSEDGGMLVYFIDPNTQRVYRKGTVAIVLTSNVGPLLDNMCIPLPMGITHSILVRGKVGWISYRHLPRPRRINR